VTRILVIGCGFPQLSLLRAARRRSLHVIGADANPRAVGVDHCDEFVEASTSDVDALAAAVRQARADALTTTGSEVALRSAAAVAARVGLPFYADSETVRRCQDKDVMRAAYAAGGLAVPAFARCSTVDEARSFAERSGYPVVVKPSRGWGQRGVARVDREEDLARDFEEARAHAAAAGLPLVVVEAWIDGRELSVNGWIEDGRLVSYCVTERLKVPGNKPLGVMIAEVAPSGLSRDEEARVVEEARRGAAALGHVRGPCYSQVALGPGGCFLYETAARLGGGFDADVTRLVSGVDLYDRLLGVALGDAALERQGEAGARHDAAVAKFMVARPGAVERIAGVERARSMPGVDDAQVFVREGGQVKPLTDSAKRAAYVLAHGTTRAQAVARADEALHCIRIETLDERDTREAEAPDDTRTEARV
jgi:biotin carboxylase